ncbi:MAG: hypothetical protein Q8L89_00980 [Gammaproteobacteria bacterium]|nr:hypothetical protein [Gammaproteobacteria bacterium]
MNVRRDYAKLTEAVANLDAEIGVQLEAIDAALASGNHAGAATYRAIEARARKRLQNLVKKAQAFQRRVARGLAA